MKIIVSFIVLYKFKNYKTVFKKRFINRFPETQEEFASSFFNPFKALAHEFYIGSRKSNIFSFNYRVAICGYR